MADWEWESFEKYFEQAFLSHVDPGPLCAPIRKATIRRDKNLDLILETRMLGGVPVRQTEHPAGTVRNNPDKAEFKTKSGAKFTATGVTSDQIRHTLSNGQAETCEISSVQSFEGDLGRSSSPRYVIEWLANVDRYYLWPDIIDDVLESEKRRTFGRDGRGPTLASTTKGGNHRMGCVRIRNAGIDAFLGVTDGGDNRKELRPGFILYLGLPSEDERERLRICLSFSLGIYLVSLGISTFDSEWKLTSFKAISGYSLDEKVFKVHTLPPAPLSRRGINEIESPILQARVDSLLASYDELDFRHLSWLYWHAVCSPAHAVPVLIGAAIEALQSSYIGRKATSIRKLASEDVWRPLISAITSQINSSALNHEIAEVLINKAKGLNDAPQGMANRRLLAHLGLQLSISEEKAWRQRNVGAHGTKTLGDDFVRLIRDNKLLMIRFHRMLFSMTGASPNYFDFYTLGHIIRNLSDPVP